jgi:hypothetical protein
VLGQLGGSRPPLDGVVEDEDRDEPFAGDGAALGRLHVADEEERADAGEADSGGEALHSAIHDVS